MAEPSQLPALNASLNFAAGVLLCLGLFFIKRDLRRAHIFAMLSATLISAVFLVSYSIYHFKVVPEVGHTSFNRGGWVRIAYFGMLASHVLLAAVNLPLILATLWRAYKKDWARHRRLARWTWPIWFYVSVTGVLVYFALYRWNAPPPAFG
ncbi:MAG: hypothetical protein CMJ89_19220 [Planctomycetes bacterium]|nr:hypothetical protein [Planctomycetota bacterium]